MRSVPLYPIKLAIVASRNASSGILPTASNIVFKSPEGTLPLASFLEPFILGVGISFVVTVFV